MSVNTLTPHEYRVRAWSTAGLLKTCWVKAWSADDAIVQVEVRLRIRGSMNPHWTISTIEPFSLGSMETLIGDEIHGSRDAG